MKDFGKIFEPINIGPVELKNRIYQPSHTAAMREDGREAAFRAEKAKGGFGLIIRGASSVHESSDYFPQIFASLRELSDLPEHEKVTSAVHRHGGKIFCQLWHGGIQVSAYNNMKKSKHPGWAPSFVQDEVNGCQCKEMEDHEIEELISAFARSATYAKTCGYDGIQLAGSHGYLISNFLSPYYNKRTDQWGGSWENRTRFLREALTRVRAAVGGDIAVSVRLNSDERIPFGGIAPDESLKTMILLNDMVDFWDLDWGVYLTGSDLVGPARLHSENYQVGAVAELRKRLYDAVSKHTPVGACGRIRTPDDVLRILEEDQLDMVGMARQSIADPHWPKKVMEGRLDEIRECIACNTCVSSQNSARSVICVTNATSGEEYKGFLPEEFGVAKEEKTILVVGGGVTGMEVAYVAASRGHTVHVHEALLDVGGHTGLLAKLPGCDQWNRIVEWRKHMLGKRGVKVVTGSELDADAILKYGADAAVFATGAVWDRQGVNPLTKTLIPGCDLPHVLTPEDVLRDGKQVGDSVLIVDSDSYLMGAGLAELLAGQGKKVSLVTYPRPAVWLTTTAEGTVVLGKLYTLNVDIIHDHFCFQITKDSAILGNLFSGQQRPIKVDTVLLVTRRVPQMDLYKEVKARKAEAEIPLEVHLTGEAITPKSWYSLPRPLFWAHELGWKI